MAESDAPLLGFCGSASLVNLTVPSPADMRIVGQILTLMTSSGLVG